MNFTVIDTKTGEYPDLSDIALHEEWAQDLMYCDMEGFAILEDGTLILMDECGRFTYCPEGRFQIVPDEPNEPLTLDELLTMDGEPVYVVYRPDISGEKPQFWALVEVDKQRVWLADKDRWAFDYKKLSADIEAIYRRPPEGET